MIATLTALAKSTIKRNKGEQRSLWKDKNYIQKSFTTAFESHIRRNKQLRTKR